MRHLRFALLGLLALAAVIALAAFVSRWDSVSASPFDPEGSACLDDFDTIDPFPAGAHANDCDGDSTPGVSSDITTTFVLPKGDSNFDTVVNFVPAELSPPSDADVPNGAIVSRLVALATLGLLDGPCNTGTLVMFVMIDATTDTSDIIKPAPKGDQLEPFAVDADGNGIPDGADHYPIHLKLVLDPDFDNIGPDGLPGTADDVNGPLQPPQPRARQFGVAKVAGITFILNFLLFDPGTPLGDLTDVDPALGFPSALVVDDPTVPLSQPSANTITDICSPLTVSTTTFGLTRDNGCTPKPAASEFRCNSDDARYTGACIIGIAALDGGCGSVSGTTNPDESGTAYRTNPASASTLNLVEYSESWWDADNDGIENPLDSCPLDGDPPDTDPRSLSNPQDPDQDGLWNSCDPNPNSPSPNVDTSRPVNPCESQGGKDEDGDCFANRSDNCPLVQNGVAFNGTILGPDSQKDTDGDAIGDACDPDPDTPTGHRHVVCNVSQVDIGGGGSAPTEDDYLCTEDVACLDTDKNGVCGPAVLIDVEPDMATNEVGTDHTVTATVLIASDGTPLFNTLVDFTVGPGPNAGSIAEELTDSNGEATFTYTGFGGPGQDTIEACVLVTVCDTVNKEWVEPAATATPVELPPQEFLRTYSAKFLCGAFMEDTEGPVKAGNYATAINVHNLQDSPLEFTKLAVLSAREDEPRSPPTPPVTLTLDPDEALEIDCPDIRQLLGLPPGEEFIKGFVVIRSDSVELDVVAVYTARFLDQNIQCLTKTGELEPLDEGACPKGSTAIGVGQGGGMSIDVEYIQAKPGPPSGAGGDAVSGAALAGTSFATAVLAVGLTLGASRLWSARTNGRRESSGGEEEP